MLGNEGMMGYVGKFLGSGMVRKGNEGILGGWGMLGNKFMLWGWGKNGGVGSIRRLWREDRSGFWVSWDLGVVTLDLRWREVTGVEMVPDNVVGVDGVYVVRVG